MKGDKGARRESAVDVDGFLDALAANGVACDRKAVAWFVNLHHRSEPFWASLLYLAKHGRAWGASFQYEGGRRQAEVIAVCETFGFPAAESKAFETNVVDASEASTGLQVAAG